MATTVPENPLAIAQEHIPMCEKHSLYIDMTCEDCDKFICAQCAKSDHREHDWNTITTAGSLRRKNLKKILTKVKEKDMKEMDEKVRKACKQMKDNQKCCEFEVSKLQKQYNAIGLKLDEIKNNYEKILKKISKQKMQE